MFNKSLVSVYFLDNKILVAELDSRKTGVRKFAAVDIPENIITDNKVQNKNALGKLLKGIWEKFAFNEKTVGIIIPEFSTFSKLLTLPKLASGELQEAVLWQAQEFLPNGSDNMIIDWKIVGKSERGYEVLIMAVPKDVLMGYVDSCELAGLFPHGVQTPSLCLTNLTNKSDDGVLIFYSGFGETILVVSKKEKILGTSVLKGPTRKEEIDTARKMAEHYQQAEVKHVFVGGKGIDEDLLRSLKDALKQEISFLRPEMSKVDAPKVEELLIPISMQIGKLNEPSDPKSLNLLPIDLVDKYKVEKTKVQVWSLTLTLTLFTWFCFLIVLGSYLVISQQITILKNKNLGNAQVSGIRIKYETDAKRINNVADKILKIKSETIVPQTIFNLLNRTRPQGVELTIYKMDLEKGDVQVIGKSIDRNSLVSYKQSLEKEKDVSNLDIPIASFEKETDLDFSMAFHYGQPILPTQNVTKVKLDEFE